MYSVALHKMVIHVNKPSMEHTIAKFHHNTGLRKSSAIKSTSRTETICGNFGYFPRRTIIMCENMSKRVERRKRQRNEQRKSRGRNSIRKKEHTFDEDWANFVSKMWINPQGGERTRTKLNVRNSIALIQSQSVNNYQYTGCSSKEYR